MVEKGEMMSSRFVGFVLLAMMALGAHASSNACDTACKEAQIKAYFERLSAVYRKGSTSADIDRLFDLFAPDVRYAHKEYDAHFGRGPPMTRADCSHCSDSMASGSF